MHMPYRQDRSGIDLASGVDNTAGAINLPIQVILTLLLLALLYEMENFYAAKSSYHIFLRIVDVFRSIYSSDWWFVGGSD